MITLVLVAALVGQEATGDLIAKLRNPDAGVRREAAARLRERPPADRAQVEALAGALRGEPEAAVRYELVRALGGSGAPAERLRPELMWAAGDPDGAVRWAAIEQIGSCRIGGPEVAAALEARLADPHVAAREAAAVALAGADPDPERSALRLIRLWSQGDEGARKQALGLLEALGAGAAPPALARALDLAEGAVAEEAAGRLARFPGAGTAALSRALRSGDARKRAAAAGALAEQGGEPEAVEALLEAMDVHDPGIRIAAANALARSLHSVPVEQLQRVCDVFERARSEGLRGRLHDRDLARLHERLGHWSEAIRCWEEYRNGDPPQGFCATGRDAEELWVRQSGIARCALRAGQRERAWAAFRKLPGFDGDERAASLQFEFLGRIGRFEGRWNRVEALGAGELGDADALFGLARVVRHGFLGGSVGVAEEREELIGLGRLLGRLGDPAVARLTAALTAGDPMAVELAGDTGLASLIPALERALEADAFRLHRWMIEAALRRLRESR